VISDNLGWYRRSEKDDCCSIDKITKDDILSLLDLATDKEVVFEMDEITGDNLANPAHKIIYSNLYSKFAEILANRDRFLDESVTVYKDALDKYSID
jgi:hypothetical protein